MSDYITASIERANRVHGLLISLGEEFTRRGYICRIPKGKMASYLHIIDGLGQGIGIQHDALLHDFSLYTCIKPSREKGSCITIKNRFNIDPENIEEIATGMIGLFKPFYVDHRFLNMYRVIQLEEESEKR